MDSRIAQRVEKMWQAGFVGEVEGLLKVGLREGRTASRALGYRQIISYLDGACTEAEAKEQTITRTRQFSRKQLGWFRRDPRIRWFAAGAEPTASLPGILAAIGYHG
jgi:tRNA dimethylallyltransferase